jgi:hypothetical protein
MAYGLSTRAFIEDGPAEQSAKVDSRRSTARMWHALSAACRLELIEQALCGGRSSIDGFPHAL